MVFFLTGPLGKCNMGLDKHVKTDLCGGLVMEFIICAPFINKIKINPCSL